MLHINNIRENKELYTNRLKARGIDIGWIKSTFELSTE